MNTGPPPPPRADPGRERSNLPSSFFSYFLFSEPPGAAGPRAGAPAERLRQRKGACGPRKFISFSSCRVDGIPARQAGKPKPARAGGLAGPERDESPGGAFKATFPTAGRVSGPEGRNVPVGRFSSISRPKGGMSVREGSQKRWVVRRSLKYHLGREGLFFYVRKRSAYAAPVCAPLPEHITLDSEGDFCSAGFSLIVAYSGRTGGPGLTFSAERK